MLVDKSKAAIKIIEENAIKTKLALDCTIKLSDATDYLRRNRGTKFDIIFLDPPYASGLYAPILRLMLECQVLKPTTLIVCESDTESIFAGDEILSESFAIQKTAQYSKTVINILSPKEEA